MATYSDPRLSMSRTDFGKSEASQIDLTLLAGRASQQDLDEFWKRKNAMLNLLIRISSCLHFGCCFYPYFDNSYSNCFIDLTDRIEALLRSRTQKLFTQESSFWNSKDLHWQEVPATLQS